MATTNENPSPGVEIQEKEIEQLRNHFKDNIRILSSIGHFSYILKIRADQYDISLTLQLDQSYPSSVPDIMITAPRLTPDQISVVQKVLQSYGETLINQPMIMSIYSRLLRWFDENNIQSLSININPGTPSMPSTPRSPSYGKLLSPFAVYNNQNRLQQTDSTDSDSIKSNSVKTIDLLLSRIESDSRLDKRLIRVGYLDRLLGLQEKSYQDFDFRLDPSESQDRSALTLVIPKNLIQYLKYGNESIWEKDKQSETLLANIDNQQTIDDIVHRQKNSSTVSPCMNPQIDQLLNSETNFNLKRFLTTSDGLYKPNYFLSIPITNPSLIDNYLKTRDRLHSSFPNTPMLTYDPAHLHLILLTLRLNSNGQLEQFILNFKRIQEEIHYHCCYPERIVLEFRGVETFFDKIFYIKCQQNSRLTNLRTLIIERLFEQQQKQKNNELFFAGNYQEFVPHIILFKSKRKLTFLDENELKELSFGKQMVNGLYLSSFDTNENEQQTSHCVFKFDFS